MKDIIEVRDGEDLYVIDAIVAKAGNVLAIQLGDLEYAQDFGVDKKYFLETPIQIQNDSFRSYLIQRLTESQVNVLEVGVVVEKFYQEYKFNVSPQDDQNSGGFIL